jgi:hypothetical protein
VVDLVATGCEMHLLFYFLVGFVSGDDLEVGRFAPFRQFGYVQMYLMVSVPSRCVPSCRVWPWARRPISSADAASHSLPAELLSRVMYSTDSPVSGWTAVYAKSMGAGDVAGRMLLTTAAISVVKVATFDLERVLWEWRFRRGRGDLGLRFCVDVLAVWVCCRALWAVILPVGVLRVCVFVQEGPRLVCM